MRLLLTFVFLPLLVTACRTAPPSCSLLAHAPVADGQTQGGLLAVVRPAMLGPRTSLPPAYAHAQVAFGPNGTTRVNGKTLYLASFATQDQLGGIHATTAYLLAEEQPLPGHFYQSTVTAHLSTGAAATIIADDLQERPECITALHLDNLVRPVPPCTTDADCTLDQHGCWPTARNNKDLLRKANLPSTADDCGMTAAPLPQDLAAVCQHGACRARFDCSKCPSFLSHYGNCTGQHSSLNNAICQELEADCQCY